MEIGKVPNEILEKIVLNNIENKRAEVIVHAGIGKDCAVIDYGEYGCVLSSDPITGAVNNIGSLAIHISCNDIAASGAEPIGVMLTMLMPVGTTADDIESIVKDAGKTAKELNVEIIGGHTEITDAVNKVVLVTTVVGKQDRDEVLEERQLIPGDSVIMTKYAGIEGTSIIAHDLEEKLKGLVADELIEDGKEMAKMLSVLREGRLGGKWKVKYMHDITEGGVLGAVWETAKANNVGIEIVEEHIPIKRSTREICKAVNIDPLKLISSGSMIIVIENSKRYDFMQALEKEGVESREIGVIKEKDIRISLGGISREIESPGSDEIYRVI